MKNRNVLLLAMSTLPAKWDEKEEDDKKNYYQYQNREPIEAMSQLEPITHMLNDELERKGEKLDTIIILETKETKVKQKIQKNMEGKQSAVDFYKERVAKFAQKVDYKDVPIDENEPAEGIRDAINRILEENKKCQTNDNMKLWIDTQGGFRDVVMVFTAIISLLKEQGIEAEGIYSIRFDANNTKENPCPIIDQTKKYDIFKFVSAMQEFMDFGKATGLKKYYDNKDNSFVQAIGKIADAIQMCQPRMFEEALRGFAKYLDAEEEKEINKDPYLPIFVKFIKEDYGVLLDKPDDTIEQIRWCVRKEFYQQAMTIYTERIPQYYYKYWKKIINVDATQKSSYGKNPYTEAFYTKLFDEMIRDERSEQLDAILTEVKEYEKVNELDSVIQYLKKQKKKQGLDLDVQAAVDNLIKCLQNNFDDSGKRTKKKKSVTSTIQEYIENYCGRKGKGKRGELLGGNRKEYFYEKKVRAIEEAKSKSPDIVKLMEYYLAVKLLRNRINHASDAKGEDDEKKAIEFLKEDGIDIGLEIVQDELQFDYQKIKKLLTDGINCFN